MSMAASLAAMLIGADVTALGTVAASKGADVGKSFAESFGAQMASITKMEPKTDAGQSESVRQQTAMDGVIASVKGEGEGEGNGDMTAAAFVALMKPGAAAQPVSMLKVDAELKVDGQMSPSSARALMTTAVVGTGVQVAQSASVETSRSTAVLMKSPVVVLHDASDSVKGLGVGEEAESLEPVATVKGEPTTEAAPIVSPIHTFAQNGSPQSASQWETPAPAKAVVDALGQINVLRSEKKFVEKGSDAKISVEEASSVKTAAKKQENTKATLGPKAVDTAKEPAGNAGLNGASAASAPGQAAVVSAACIVAAPNVSGCKPQIVSQSAVENVPVRPTGNLKQSAQTANTAKDEGVTKQAPVPGKTSVRGPEIAGPSGGDSLLLQKGDLTVKTSPVPAAGVRVTKEQSGNATAQLVHSVTNAAVSVANMTTGSSVIHAAVVVSQKGATADASGAVMAAHAGNGESSSMQMQSTDGGHRTFTTTPTVLEVGIPSGTQGWLKVRAELAGGGVNASVSAASSAGQEMLHRELPGLTAYLRQEKVAVNSVVVHAPAGDAFRGLSGGLGNGVGGQMQGQGRSGRQPTSTASQMFFEGARIPEGDEVLTAVQSLRGGGGWLSVRV